MNGYNNSIAAAALLLGISPEMLMKCLEGSTAIAEMQLKIDALNLQIERMQNNNDELCRIITERLVNGKN
jgi:hypothetical protein